MKFPKNKYHEFTWIKGDPIIGEGTWIGPFCIIDGTGGLTIGSQCDISSGTHIYTHSSVKRCVSGKKFLADGNINRDEINIASVSIGNNTFIGPNSVISMGVRIGSHCVIGACSFVNSDISDNSIYAGSPAKKIGEVKFNEDKTVIYEYEK